MTLKPNFIEMSLKLQHFFKGNTEDFKLKNSISVILTAFPNFFRIYRQIAFIQIKSKIKPRNIEHMNIAQNKVIRNWNIYSVPHNTSHVVLDKLLSIDRINLTVNLHNKVASHNCS